MDEWRKDNKIYDQRLMTDKSNLIDATVKIITDMLNLRHIDRIKLKLYSWWKVLVNRIRALLRGRREIMAANVATLTFIYV